MHLPQLLIPHASSLAASAASSGWGLGIGLIVFVLILLAVVVLLIVAQWKIFQKAGKPGWAILVPFYNTVVRLGVVGKPLWWVVLLFIPFVNLFLFVIITRRLAAVFGKGAWFTVGLIFLPFIFYPILAFGKSQYMNTFPPAAPMSDAVKWTLIALLAFALIDMPFIASSRAADSYHAPLRAFYASGYATDGTYVYYNDNAIPGADAKSFKVLGDYGVDDKAVYLNDEVVADADPATFEALNTSYSYSDIGKDAHHVFAFSEIVPDADPATFVILDDSYSKDATHVYYDDQGLIAIEGADPATFTVNTSTTDAYDAADSTGKYLYGERIIAKK